MKSRTIVSAVIAGIFAGVSAVVSTLSDAGVISQTAAQTVTTVANYLWQLAVALGIVFLRVAVGNNQQGQQNGNQQGQ